MKNWIKILRALARRIDGSAAVEFAIIVPVLIALLGGIMEGGRLMWTRNSIQSATEQAARYVMVNPAANDTQIQNVATNYYNGVGGGSPTFAITRQTVGTMDFVSITGSLQFNPIWTLADFGAVTLSGKARVPIGES